MGMAASQARYLALTARKTNTEWEGQQINQARTALANQSANLFNQLLALEVPNAPKTTDFTELQYSFTDGQNESVIEDWKQLSTADPNYNYIVNHYYYADIYTGSRKLLQDPQITIKGTVSAQSWLDYAAANFDNEEDDTDVPEIPETPVIPGGEDVIGDDPEPEPTEPTVEVRKNSDGSVSVMIDGEEMQAYLPVSSYDLERHLDLKNALNDLDQAKIKAHEEGILNRDDVYGYKDSTGVWHFLLANEEEPTDYCTTYAPDAVGNCPLKELDKLTDMQAAELLQIIKDCPDSNMTQYLSIDIDGNLVYNGSGVYTFTMNGVEYFTNLTDLNNGMETNYVYDKNIDNQQRLAYYNASYLKTKIEETNYALLETDGNGRFKTVKFDDDSVVYTLNTETVTDEAAYQDAMNEYNYKIQQYEKTIADINARTSIIQQEDRTLELRLKQLDTEQLALKTEMEAVQKVIKENVEKTFKTFAD